MMRIVSLSIAGALIVALGTAASAEGARKRSRKAEPPVQREQPLDKRDRLVNAPGSPFNKRAYWHALSQCGGFYFKLGRLYADAAISARVVRPDRSAEQRFTKSAESAQRTASAFLIAAERILVADREVGRDAAIVTYDAVANAAGERHKSVDAADGAARPCPALYELCAKAFDKVCDQKVALTTVAFELRKA